MSDTTMAAFIGAGALFVCTVGGWVLASLQRARQNETKLEILAAVDGMEARVTGHLDERLDEIKLEIGAVKSQADDTARGHAHLLGRFDEYLRSQGRAAQ